MAETFTNVACTVCGCVCDDLTVTTENGRIVRAEEACRLAEPCFLRQNSASSPIAEIDGLPMPIEDAYACAAELLKAAKAPLIYGLGRTTTDGQRAAVALADRLGATIDTAGDPAATVAFQQVGQSTCTLGEIRQRADLVIFWGSDPISTHPRFLERYCSPRSGRVVVVDEQETDTARLADLFLQVTSGRHWEALWALRMLARGLEPRTGCDIGATLELLRGLVDRVNGSKFGVVCFGDALTRGPLGHRTVEALFQLVADRNDHARFYAVRMKRDVAGADSVLAWQTGYPFGVNFGKGFPRSNPGETTGPDVLARGEADVCVLIGDNAATDLSEAALAHLRRIPVILLDEPGAESPIPATVRFTTPVYGVHTRGTAHRMDDVSIPLRVLLPTEYPANGEVLSQILRRIQPV